METTQVKALELVRDWSLWPRYEAGDIDRTNLNRMKETLKAGLELPPIIVDRQSKRIVDGFTRHEAYLKLYGDTTDIPVEFHEYSNDAEIFIEAARLNAQHGLPLSPQDKIHVVLQGRKMGLPIMKIAEAIGMSKERAQDFLKSRTAVTKRGERIPLAAGALKLAGKKLNKDEEYFARHSNGMQPTMNARLLLNALNGTKGIPLTSRELSLYIELRDALTEKINQTLEDEGRKAA